MKITEFNLKDLVSSLKTKLAEVDPGSQQLPYKMPTTPFNFKDYEYGPDGISIQKKKMAPQDSTAPAPQSAAPTTPSVAQAFPIDGTAGGNTGPLNGGGGSIATQSDGTEAGTSTNITIPQPTPTKARPGLRPGGNPEVYDWQEELRKKNPAIVPDGLWGPQTDAEAKRQPNIKPPASAKPLPPSPTPQPAPQQQQPAPQQQQPAPQPAGPVTTTISPEEAERRQREAGVGGPSSGAEDYYRQHYNPDGTEKVQPAPVQPKTVTPAPQPQQGYNTPAPAPLGVKKAYPDMVDRKSLRENAELDRIVELARR